MQRAVSKLGLCVALALCALLQAASVLLLAGSATAATPGLPFTEDFSNTALRDPLRTNANWSTAEQALLLGGRRKQFGAFGAGLAGTDITADAHRTRSVALGDVDGDGDLDLVVANQNQPNRLYLNNGTANPWNGVSGTDITADTGQASSVVLGDVDGDGDLDLVVGRGNTPNRLYLNNGTADPFSGVTGSNITADVRITASVALGDVDGDGDLDLVAGNQSQANRLYLNNGTADPWGGVSGANISADVRDTRAVVLGDVDGDGDLDLVAGNLAQANRLYLNNGTADPWNGVSGADISADAQGTVSVVLGDVDGDGDLDLAVGNSAQANRLYLNNGTANPWNGVIGTDITGDIRDTRAMALGDVDGDGDLDLVAGNSADTNRLYRNNGTAYPWNGVLGTDITADVRNTRSVALGDVDGDGDLDLVAGNEVPVPGQVNRLYLNSGTTDLFAGVSGTDITDDSGTTYSQALGDVDGDGDLDLVAGKYNGVNRLYLNNGTANPWNGLIGRDITADVRNTYSVALGDMDGDGDLDLVVGNLSLSPSNQPSRLYLNNGTADPFSGVSGTDITADVRATTAVALGDVDGDGDLDLVTGNLTQANRLYLNNGTADPFSGVSGTDITADVRDTFSVALGDVDRDGDLDLVVGNYSPSPNNQPSQLYLNNGTADPFSGVSGTNITADVRNTYSVALGDVDGDGDLDLIAGTDTQGNRLYLNNGTADPWNGVSGIDIIDGVQAFSVALGDMDGDGDLDLVTGTGFRNRLTLNNGTANPFSGVSASNITTDTALTFSVVLGDADGDGDLDVVAGRDNRVNRLYRTNGFPDPVSGWAGSNTTADAHLTRAVALGDVDRDGDLDLIAGNEGQASRLYRNNGTADPWNGVTGTLISADVRNTTAVVLRDVDGDGDLDLVVGNRNQANRLHLNNGTADPWNGISGSDITSDADNTTSVAMGDVDGDGDLDLVVGNQNQANRLYLNNGTANPWGGVGGTNITADIRDTAAVELGDIDSDGDLDLVVGNLGQANRLYLNNGTANPWGGVSGSDISADAHGTTSVALGDVDGDGDLDLVAGNQNQPNRIYLNNGTATPWGGVSGSNISADADDSTAVVLRDVDRDSDLDLIVGNFAQPNRIYLNNGTLNPFSGVSASDISADARNTFAVAVGDVDRDGLLDHIAGNYGQPNRLYQRRLFNTARGKAGSVRVDAQINPITSIYLGSTATLPPNAGVTYWLSNNGGARWFQTRPGAFFNFPTAGTDLRWRAELSSLSPARTPRVEELTLSLTITAQTITLGANPGPLIYAPSGTFTVSATGGASGNPVTFTSSTAAVCTTGGSTGATVTIVTAGTCTIAANQAGNASYSAAPQVTQSITINRANQATLTATATSTSLTVGQTATLGSTGGSGTGAVSFSSNNANCTVSGTTLTAAAAGGCTITATRAADSNYNVASSAGLAITTLPLQDPIFGNGFE